MLKKWQQIRTENWFEHNAGAKSHEALSKTPHMSSIHNKETLPDVVGCQSLGKNVRVEFPNACLVTGPFRRFETFKLYHQGREVFQRCLANSGQFRVICNDADLHCYLLAEHGVTGADGYKLSPQEGVKQVSGLG